MVACRYSKHDGQLQKTLDQLMEGVVDYFVWQNTHAPDAEVEGLCFEHFVRFVDALIVYFTNGVPNQLVSGILKVVKLQSSDTRARVCNAHEWMAHSMAGSAALWISAGPPLRAALESGSGKNSDAPDQGGRKRARV